ncbi:hypothetical protein SAMN05421770_1048 [Granulicella rosea]|uniref:Chromosome partitioning ATPase, Mrp family, contains Fe-S cluster n=1 Tax=Granulicella rosea TaxID=474952 RepID=A0A239JKR4_9BACT|nr:hypothetical protein [Granulicella rosea]SNT06471.1 hypothetical protein SAMN05421770_1048 [Granulicella rosea]
MIATQSNTVPAYEGLLYTVFQQLRQNARHGLVVALTSANPGEGVTHSIQALTAGLGKDSLARTLSVDSRRLRALTADPGSLVDLCEPIGPSIFELVRTSARSGPHSWESWQYRQDCVQQLRAAFDYVLIDCPSLREAGDALSLAPFVDGVIMVVEADKTRRDQILHAEKTIEFARGNLIGHILNKRNYLVPDWIYRRL